MNQIEKMASTQKVFEMLDYMAAEIVFNMKKIILSASHEEDKYAIKHEVNKKTFAVSFMIYNTETQHTVAKTIDVHEFSRICSFKQSLEAYFNEITYIMLEVADKKDIGGCTYI